MLEGKWLEALRTFGIVLDFRVLISDLEIHH